MTPNFIQHLIAQTLCLILSCTLLSAQTLRPAEVVSLSKSGPKQADSLLRAKGFSMISTRGDSTRTLVAYGYQEMQNGSKVQRLLLIGWTNHFANVEVEYDVWQQRDAQDWTNQLLQAGYKKTDLGSPETKDKSPLTVSIFKKGNNGIYCQEQTDSKSGGTVYKFSITPAHFKGNTL
jgi:hypothetical protein